MNSKKAQALVRVALILGILILVNIISIRIFSRLDLTAQHVYTLSDASKKLARSLDDRVTVKAYFTEDLPAPYNNNRRAVLDLLNEYKAYAEGNLQYDFINPEGQTGEQEAQQQGIPPVEVQVVKEDKFEVKRAYLGLTMLYGTKRETLPVVQNLGTLEYDISSALKRLTEQARKKIGYTTGHEEPLLPNLKQVSQILQKQYDLVSVDLGKNEPVPPDIAELLIISPQTKFADSAKYQIDQYLMRGGKVAFLLNRVNATLQSRMAQSLDLGLEDLLEQYGVRINPDLVRDAQCANVNVVQQQGPFMLQSQRPFVYLPNASNFNKDNMIVKDLQSVIFHFVSSIDTSLASSKGLRADVLIRSSKRSGRQTGFFMIDPFQQYTLAELSEQGIPLAAVVEGSFNSYFANREPKASLTHSPEARIVVVGDGDFMKDEFLGNRGNLTFFTNLADYLADDTGLISIRSKNIVMPPLEQISDGTKKMLKYGDLIVPPLLVVGYGLFRWRRRIAMKKALEAQL